MDHVVPIAHGGETSAENLALACFGCNRRRWDRRAGIDTEQGGAHPLFNPREHRWNEHFAWSADALTIVAATSIGRATLGALDFNRERVQQIRAADAVAGRHPPAGDRRLL
jgi:hypothetical protein